MDELDFMKLKTSGLCKMRSRESEDKLGRKYLQKTHLIKDYYLKYTKEF